jgi:RNA polymerase sigma-70 factor, ECF subfamily
MALAPDDMGAAERGTVIRLVAAHRSGDAGAFAEIVRTHYPTLLACARRRLSNTQDAEDAVQEAFLRAYRRLGMFGSGGDWRLGAWLNTILSNVCADTLARRRPTTTLDERSVHAHADDRPDAADLVSDPVALRAVVDAIAALPASQRSAFVLRMVNELPYEEVAGQLGITEDNARTRVRRARSALQRFLSTSDAVSGMLAGVPLLLFGSLRSGMRRLFAGANDPTHVTAGTQALSTGAAGASSEAVSIATGPLGTGMQMISQLATTPVAQAALAASTAGTGRGSAVMGVVAGLAAAGSLTVPAVANTGATATPPGTTQAAPVLVSAAATTKPAPATHPNAATTSTSASSAPTSTSTTASGVSSAPATPSWVAVAASAAVNGTVVTASTTAPSKPATTSTTSPPSTTAPTSTSTGSGGGTATTSPSATSPPSTAPSSSDGGTSTLPIGTCAGVTGFQGVTAPTSVPALTSDNLKAVMSTGSQAITSASAPAFSSTGSVSAPGGSAAPVQVKVGTCLAAGGSILAVDMTGTTGAEVQLVGSLVSAPVVVSSTAKSGKEAVDYLFRGQVTQIAGPALPGGRLPWNLPQSFVAEVQVQPTDTASLEVVFLQTIATATPAAATTTTTATSGTTTDQNSGISHGTAPVTATSGSATSASPSTSTSSTSSTTTPTS